MDSANTKPTEPNAAPVEAPVEEQAPVSPVPAAKPVGTVNPVNPAVAATMAAEQPAPAPAPAAPSVSADVANAALNPPVNPVITPGANANAAVAGGTMSMNQMFQTQPANQVGGVLDDTTPIAVPEGPKAPDPIEEELKAPLKAAAPAPGSIGSAVSGPADANSPANVAFNDPAMEANNPMTANTAPNAKKDSFLNKMMIKTKMNKRTLIMLCIVAGVIVVALIFVLIMLITGIL